MTESVESRLSADMKAALRAGEEGRLRLSVIRMARAALQNAGIEKRRSLTDDEAVAVVAREVKQRRDSAREYKELGRADKAEALEVEIAVLEAYLPEQLSDAELRDLISEAIAAVGAKSRRDMGKVMGKVMPLVRGRADGQRVNELVITLLPDQ
ncbi:MAG: GatB/YqeY domain-containing protein [Bacillota bacterium]|nr:MAG: GatB/YqeY domain-containing protein [Bacillota bacterium]